MAFPLEAHDVGVRATGTSTDLFNLMAANRKNSALNDGVESAVFTMLVTVIGLSVNISFITHRCTLVQNWWGLPWTMWLVLGIHVNAWAFFMTGAVLRYLISYNQYEFSCDRAYHMCIFYLSFIKMLMSLFLVERAHIVLSQGIPRLKSRLYVLNLTAVIVVYTICFVLYWPNHWPFHTTRIIDDLCMAGVARVVLLLNMLGDGVLNVYLTALFLLPLLRSHSFRDRKLPFHTRSLQVSASLRELALRTFIGSVVTLVSITVNIVAFTALRAEPIWLCLLSCEADTLVTTIMIHWIAPGERTVSEVQTTERSEGSNVDHIHLVTLQSV